MGKKRAVLNEQSYSWANVNGGVPQVFILEPFLFLMHINNLADGYPLILSFMLMILLFLQLFMTQ